MRLVSGGNDADEMLGVNGENIARWLIRAWFVPCAFQTLMEPAKRVALRDNAFRVRRVYRAALCMLRRRIRVNGFG
jgi:hypothetical protein